MNHHTANLSRRFIGVLALFTGLLLLFRLGLLVYLHGPVVGVAEELASILRLDGHASDWLRGTAAWTGSALLAALVSSWLAWAVWPFTAFRRLAGWSLALLVASGLWTFAPRLAMACTDRDAPGFARRMNEVTPDTQTPWFAPDGTPLLWFTRDEGVIRLWNRPGFTPDHGLEAKPVDAALREAWMRQEAERKRIPTPLQQAMAEVESARARDTAEYEKAKAPILSATAELRAQLAARSRRIQEENNAVLAGLRQYEARIGSQWRTSPGLVMQNPFAPRDGSFLGHDIRASAASEHNVERWEGVPDEPFRFPRGPMRRHPILFKILPDQNLVRQLAGTGQEPQAVYYRILRRTPTTLFAEGGDEGDEHVFTAEFDLQPADGSGPVALIRAVSKRGRGEELPFERKFAIRKVGN